MCCPPSSLKRVHYFHGQLLGVEDLQAEQEYFRERLRRHNRCFHGWGVVCGLELSVTGSRVVIAPGLALDCRGNEVVLPELLPVDLPTSASAGVAQYVVLSHGEDFSDPAPGDQEPEGALRYSRVLESYRHELLAEEPGARVDVLGGAVDADLFYPSSRASPDQRHLVFVGRLVTEKGIWILLEAFQRQTTADLLVIVGEGPLFAPLRKVISEQGLEQRVSLVGYVPPDHLREILIECSLMIVPSIWQEPLGLVVLEGLACGVPVVASAVGGIPEMIDQGRNGLLVPASDSGALAAAIDGILGNPELYGRMRKAARGTRVKTYIELAETLVNTA
jgi:glycosyltransferase involved in cell wall biosynthesis